MHQYEESGERIDRKTIACSYVSPDLLWRYPDSEPDRQTQSFDFYFAVARTDITRMIASPEGPMLSVPTITGSASRMLISVFRPVLS